MEAVRAFLRALLYTALALVLVVLGIVAAAGGFHGIHEMRQLERAPRTEANAIVEGEANVDGKVWLVEGAEPLLAPTSRQPCVYYHWTRERRKRDSKGKTSWSTEATDTRFVPFRLADGSGSIRVLPTGDVGFTVGQSFQTTQGDLRYTESRIDPSETIFVFAFAVTEPGSGEMVLSFDRPGSYSPIISESGEASARASMATVGFFLCWLGVALLSLAVVFVCAAFKSYRLVAYILLVGFAVTGTLSLFGVSMLKDDLRAAHERVVRQTEEAKRAIGRTLEGIRLRWDGDWAGLGSFDDPLYARLTDADRRRARRIRVDLERTIERTNRLRNEFPERLLASAAGIPEAAPIPLPPEDAKLAASIDADFAPTALDPALGLGLALVGAVAALVLTWLGFRSIKQKRYIENIPTSATKGVCFGLTEVAGRIVAGPTALRGPVTHTPCVYYRHKVEEKRGSGKKKRWETIIDEERRTEFLCKDREGEIRIVPADAEILTKHCVQRREGNFRSTEWRLDVGDPLYCLGSAEIDGGGDRLEIRRGPAEYPFILSNHPEDEVKYIKGARGRLKLNFALDGLLLALLALFGVLGRFRAPDYLIAAMAAPAYILGIYVAVMFNDLVFLRLRVRRSLANLDVALKKRFDLVPALERVTKAFLAHESDVQTRLAEMRAIAARGRGATLDPAAMTAFVAGEHFLFRSLVAVRNRYPDLLGQAANARLIESLARLENEVALMREGINSAVERYNTRLAHIPEVFVARVGGFREESFLQLEAERVDVGAILAPARS